MYETLCAPGPGVSSEQDKIWAQGLMFPINSSLPKAQSLPGELLVTTVSFMALCRVGRKAQWSHWKSEGTLRDGETGQQQASGPADLWPERERLS